MLDIFLYLAASTLFLFVGYLVSVFSNAIYVDPEEIRTFFPDLSEGRKRQMEKFISNPRAFMQVAFIVRLSSALALGILALQIAQRLSQYSLVPGIAVYIAVPIIFWLAALIIMIYLPRRLSPQQAKPKMIRFLPFINFIYLIISPALTQLGKISSGRVPREISEDEKDDIVERAIESLAESAGIPSPIIEEDEKEMIHQIFQLDVTETEEIMIPRINVTGIESDAKLERIRELTEKFGYSRYPVFEGTIDDIIGIINVKDLLILNENQRHNFKLTDHMREPLRVGEHKKIDQLLADFKRTKTHMAIVIDEFGGTAGVVTLEDILEEIVGEIEDEHDPEHSRDIVRLGDGSLEVTGACPLEDLAEELGLELQQDDFETVGGMIYDMVGSVPAQGTALTWQHCRMKVLEVEGQRIKKVRVSPQAGPIQ
jgi:CBS domain containing-hemolysin-like protein